MRYLTTRLYALLLLFCTLLPTAGEAQRQLAFPGASGYAQYVTGGRGGKVYYVTSLRDCSDDNLVPGTLRWALRSGDDSPRTILFAVPGTIYLESKLRTNHPNVSILGQSAPGGGICITGYPVYINSRNYIIRFVRFRAGEIPAIEGSGNESYSGLDIENAENILLDHCSVTWSMEECLTMFDNDTTTVQHCIIGEGLYHSYNVKTTGETAGRSFAMQWGGEHSNMHHVLITNSNGRGPRFNGVRSPNAWLSGKEGKAHAHDCQIDGDFANNVFYNWGGGHLSYYGGEFYASNFADAPEGFEAYNRIYMRNNYFRPGPSTQKNGSSYRHFFHPSGDNDKQVGQWYLEGNKFETSSYYAPKGSNWTDASLQTVNDDNLAGFGTSTSALDMASAYSSHLLYELPYQLSPYTPVSADQAYLEVTDQMRGAGACLPRYDEEDQRLIDEAAGRRDGIAPFVGSRASNASQRPGIIDRPEDVTFTLGNDEVTTAAGNVYTCYPSLALRQGDMYAIDSDADGMPDAYEEAIGLDPFNTSDGATLADNGYTHLENYLNALADYTLSARDYQTSQTYVEPGLATRPEWVTLTFVFDDPAIEGTLPNPITVAYGASLTFHHLHALYRQGYTHVGWTDGTMTYHFDQDYKGYFVQDVTLRPALQPNDKELSDRTDDLSICWDFTQPGAPTLHEENQGIYTTWADIDGTLIDVPLYYQGLQLTLPAAEGAVATVTYADGTTQDYAALSETLTLTLSQASVKTICITLPYVVDFSDKVFHTPLVGQCTVGTEDYYTTEGENERVWSADKNRTDARNFVAERATNYELVYGNLATIHSTDWMETRGQERDAYRNVINPNGDDEVQYSGNETTHTHPLNGFIVGQSPNSTYKLYAYVKDCSLVRTYAAGSGSGGDYMQVIAIPTDNSERLTSNNIHKLYKSSSFSEFFDLELDPNISYRLEWSSIGGVDMMVGAIKLYDRTAQGETSGDAVVMWDWNNEASVHAVVDPTKAFQSATAQIGSALRVQQGENGNDQDGNTLYVVQLKQTSAADGPQPDHCIEYKVTPTPGYTFTPTEVRFSRRFETQGTDAQGQIDVYFKYGQEDELYIRKTAATSSSENVSIKSSTASFTDFFRETSQPLYIRLYLYNMPVDNWVDLFGIKVSGTYQKTGAQKHSFTTTVSPAGAGVISQSPKGTAFVADAEISLTATAASGYQFLHWVDAAGNVLSTDASFAFVMPDAEASLTAQFQDLSESEVFTDGPFQAVVSNVDQLIEALQAAAQSQDERYYIFLRNGEYDFGTTAKTAVPQRTSLIGESQEGVILFNTPSTSVKDYQNQTPVLFIDQNQNDVYMQDLTIRANRDWPNRTSQGQELALRQRGKMAIYKNVTLQGVQDTYYLNKADASAYFEDCTVAGEVDFIYGDGTMFFQHCTLQPLSSRAYITAPNTQAGYKGIVFNQCTIEPEAGAKGNVQGYRLGRPWGDSPASTFISTTMKVLPADAGWGSMTSNLVVRFHEYGSMDSEGNLLDLSKRSIADCKPASGSDSPVLTAEEAAEYTIENVFKRVAKDWTPDLLAAQLDAPTPRISDDHTLLTWPEVPGAYCYAICRDGKVIGFTTQTSYRLTIAEGQYTLRVANQRGGLGKPSDVASALGNITTAPDHEPTIYDLYGRKVQHPTSGIYVVDGKRQMFGWPKQH